MTGQEAIELDPSAGLDRPEAGPERTQALLASLGNP